MTGFDLLLCDKRASPLLGLGLQKTSDLHLTVRTGRRPSGRSVKPTALWVQIWKAKRWLAENSPKEVTGNPISGQYQGFCCASRSLHQSSVPMTFLRGAPVSVSRTPVEPREVGSAPLSYALMGAPRTPAAAMTVYAAVSENHGAKSRWQPRPVPAARSTGEGSQGKRHLHCRPETENHLRSEPSHRSCIGGDPG